MLNDVIKIAVSVISTAALFLVGVVSGKLKNYLEMKTEYSEELMTQYGKSGALEELGACAKSVVAYVNQTFVKGAKAAGVFTSIDAEKALQKARNLMEKCLSKTTLEFLDGLSDEGAALVDIKLEEAVLEAKESATVGSVLASAMASKSEKTE